MEIADPPDRAVCSAHGPLKWGWFPATKQGERWVSFTVGDGGVLVPHVCDNPDLPAARWQADPVIAERAHRGRALVDAAIAGEDITDERTP